MKPISKIRSIAFMIHSLLLNFLKFKYIIAYINFTLKCVISYIELILHIYIKIRTSNVIPMK